MAFQRQNKKLFVSFVDSFCKHRFHSQRIICVDGLVHLISKRIDHLPFPSLTRVTIFPCGKVFLDFLFAAPSPVLEHLDLPGVVGGNAFSPPAATLCKNLFGAVQGTTRHSRPDQSACIEGAFILKTFLPKRHSLPVSQKLFDCPVLEMRENS